MSASAAKPRSPAAAFARLIALSALTFFLVPVLALGFGGYGQNKVDQLIVASIDRAIDDDAERQEAQKEEDRRFFAAHPPSAVCDDPDPELARYRDEVCRPWSEPWQFVTALTLGRLSVGLGFFAYLAIAALGLVAYLAPRAQYWAFVVGSQFVTATTGLATVAHGVLTVWLSYWVTALLQGSYSLKLIIVVGFLAGAAILTVLKALFYTKPPLQHLEAEPLKPADAPALWSRVEALAARLNTAPPQTIAAGVDDNFFVTEVPHALADGTTSSGRMLYVSLPLIRTLTVAEADAVLGHELAHFSAGDAAEGARLAPALHRFAAFKETLYEAVLARPAWLVMKLFSAVFQLAVSRESRRRERLADAEAARLVSPDEFGCSLLKVASYSDLRTRTEHSLFDERRVRQGDLELQARIEAGLAPHAASPAFLDQLSALQVPHPFDTHPPLQERLANVSASIKVTDVARLLQVRPPDSWIDAIQTAAAIEGQLWAAYETQFKARHEAALAWRLLPADDEERALVCKYFPDLAFPLMFGGEMTLDCLELTAADGATLSLADIQEADVSHSMLGTRLVLKLVGPTGTKQTVKLKLGRLGLQQTQFQAAFERYWNRARSALTSVRSG